MKLILASNSPRRRQLLTLAGWTFSATAVDVDESPLPGEKPLNYVLRLAESKARAAAERAPEDAVVIAADTAVVDHKPDGEDILGKPNDPAEAKAMLQRLRGRTHQVYTGLAVLRVADRALLTDWCKTDVRMRDYTDEEIQAYIASGDPLDKAGAYAIQHSGFHPVEEIDGCYANVVGLPLCHLTQTLEKLGITPQEEAALVCRSVLQHDCTIPRQVLEGL